MSVLICCLGCRGDQILPELNRFLQMLKVVYDTFGLTYKMALSTRPEERLGDDGMWDQAEGALRDALDATGRDWEVRVSLLHWSHCMYWFHYMGWLHHSLALALSRSAKEPVEGLWYHKHQMGGATLMYSNKLNALDNLGLIRRCLISPAAFIKGRTSPVESVSCLALPYRSRPKGLYKKPSVMQADTGHQLNHLLKILLLCCIWCWRYSRLGCCSIC